MENEQTLNLSKKIDYILKADNAWIYFHIDFVNEKGQFGFDAKDQFSYEHLDLRYDLRADKPELYAFKHADGTPAVIQYIFSSSQNIVNVVVSPPDSKEDANPSIYTVTLN